MLRITADNGIALGIVSAAMIGFVLLVYYPQSGRLETIRTEIASQEVAQLENAQEASVVSEMVREVEAMNRRYSSFDRRMPKRKELAGFLREISGILASEQLANQLTEPGTPVREEFYHTLPITMKFQGSYLSLVSLLERIDKMERFTRVGKLSISTNGSDHDLNIEVQMNIYFTES